MNAGGFSTIATGILQTLSRKFLALSIDAGQAEHDDFSASAGKEPTNQPTLILTVPLIVEINQFLTPSVCTRANQPDFFSSRDME